MKNSGYIPPMLVVGIDPGVQTGWCVYNVLYNEIDEADTITFWEVHHRVVAYNTKQVFFIVEDPAQNRPTFDKGERDPKKREKISQNVGSNKREATLLIEGLRGLGFCVVEVKPEGSKWTSRYFRGITGFEGRVSQHVRDAARLVWGVRTWPGQPTEGAW